MVRWQYDDTRNELIVGDLLSAVHHGRSPLLLTARTEHLQHFEEALASEVGNVFVLKGGHGEEAAPVDNRGNWRPSRECAKSNSGHGKLYRRGV